MDSTGFPWKKAVSQWEETSSSTPPFFFELQKRISLENHQKETLWFLQTECPAFEL